MSTLRIFACSDLHIDTLSPEDYDTFTLPPADIYLIAGDLMNGVLTKHCDWLISKTNKTPTYYCPGNHEYYGTTREQALDKLNNYFKGSHIRIVLNQSAKLAPGLSLWASDFWTDMKLTHSQPSVVEYAQLHWNDFKNIHFQNECGKRLLQPLDTVEWNKEALSLYRRFINQTNDDVILMSHHGLYKYCLPNLKNSLPFEPQDSLYTSDLAFAIESLQKQPLAVINGHIHNYNHVTTVSGTQLYSNPRGPNGDLTESWLEIKQTSSGHQISVQTDEPS